VLPLVLWPLPVRLAVLAARHGRGEAQAQAGGGGGRTARVALPRVPRPDHHTPDLCPGPARRGKRGQPPRPPAHLPARVSCVRACVSDARPLPRLRLIALPHRYPESSPPAPSHSRRCVCAQVDALAAAAVGPHAEEHGPRERRRQDWARLCVEGRQRAGAVAAGGVGAAAGGQQLARTTRGAQAAAAQAAAAAASEWEPWDEYEVVRRCAWLCHRACVRCLGGGRGGTRCS
jgi:hypothetical protein